MAKTILIVDDSKSLRQVVSMALTSVGYNVIEAEDGQDGLDRLSDNRVHLVISDVNMPVMDGIEFLRNIKLLARYKFTPVIMLTTESEPEMKEQGRLAGAKAWMVKPFMPEQMIEAVSKLII